MDIFSIENIIGAVSFFIFLFLIIIIFRRRKIKSLERSLDMTLFLVKLPRYDNKSDGNKEEEKKMISKMEQFYSNFLSLDKGDNFLKRFFYGHPRVVLEIASEVGERDISFYVSVPSKYESSLGSYIQGIYSGAIVEKVSGDYTVFEPEGEVVASYLTQENNFFLPLNNYEELSRDPLESIVNSVTNISADEGSAVQVVIRPTSFNIRKKGEKLLHEITDNRRSFKEALTRIDEGIFMKIIRELTESSSKEKKKEDKEEKEMRVDEATLQLVRKKIEKQGFEVNIRLIATAKDKNRAEDVLSNLESSFSQFTSGVNGFKVKRIKKKKALKRMIYDFSFREFRKGQVSILNTSELTGIYHFPLSHIESPYIKWVKSKETAPPVELPKEGVIFIGNTLYRGDNKDVYIPSREDRRRHFYIIGQTGVGKTTLMREKIRQDMENGEGVGVIDPHGDLIEDTLANVPKNRIDDVVLFEPFDRSRPCGLNMLEWKTPEQRDFALSEMVMIFNQLFDQAVVGPMFEYYMRNAMAALSANKNDPGTIAEIPRIFSDDNFMEEKLRGVSDHMIRNFWLREWKQTTGQTRSDMLGYVVSKIGRFVTDEMMRNIIGQQKSGFDLEDIMNGRKIFLANLSKGLTGELNSHLLGMILVSKMQIAALRRASIPEEERKDFYLYVDEFQNFTTDSVSTILSEARKYKLNLILAHQYMPQLKEEIKDAVIGNVGTIASYRVGVDDAEFLERQFSPEFSKFDLGNIDNRQYIIRMMINNQISSPFKVAAPKPAVGDKEIGEVARKTSKMKYGRPKEIVEAEIKERAKI